MGLDGCLPAIVRKILFYLEQIHKKIGFHNFFLIYDYMHEHETGICFFSIDPGSTKEVQLSDFKSPSPSPGIQI